MIRDIVKHTDPSLRNEAERFDFSNPQMDPIELARDLFETLIQNQGLGLSAPEIGLPYRAFAMYSNPGIVCFNPRVVDQTSEELAMEEGCLSHKGLTLKVKRPRTIKVRYNEPNGEVVTKKLDGMSARIFLHELDHLDGVLYTDRVSDLQLSMAKKRQKKLARKK